VVFNSGALEVSEASKVWCWNTLKTFLLRICMYYKR
jgi:hypothetical protein